MPLSSTSCPPRAGLLFFPVAVGTARVTLAHLPDVLVLEARAPRAVRSRWFSAACHQQDGLTPPWLLAEAGSPLTFTPAPSPRSHRGCAPPPIPYLGHGFGHSFSSRTLWLGSMSFLFHLAEVPSPFLERDQSKENLADHTWGASRPGSSGSNFRPLLSWPCDAKAPRTGFKRVTWSSRRGAAETNPTRNHEVACSTPGLIQWVEDPALL